MDLRPAYVRSPGCIARCRIPQAFELSAANVFQIDAVRPGSRSLVKVHRHTEPSPNLQSSLTRKHRTLSQREAAHRHERHHISRANPRMDAILLCQVDQLRRPSYASHGRLQHRCWRTRDCHHRPVMRRVHRPIQKAHRINLHCRYDLSDLGRVNALGKIGHALDHGIRIEARCHKFTSTNCTQG